MAIFCLIQFSKRLPSIGSFRLLNKAILVQKSLQFSTTKFMTAKDATPVKYSLNKAAKMEIAETIGLKTSKNSSYSSYIIIGSLAVFLIYFCILREENDLDELLKGNVEMSEELKLIDFKIKLIYCQQNNLPVDKLKAKIEELESHRKVKPTFRL